MKALMLLGDQNPMKTVTVADAQAELPKLIAEAEPLVLTDASRAVAVLIHLASPIAGADPQLTVLPLRQFLLSGNARQAVNDDSAYVISTREAAPPDEARRDWWAALQAIAADQEARGFVGTVSDIDRDDEGYDQRMSEIEKHTVSREQSLDVDLS